MTNGSKENQHEHCLVHERPHILLPFPDLSLRFTRSEDWYLYISWCNGDAPVDHWGATPQLLIDTWDAGDEEWERPTPKDIHETVKVFLRKTRVETFGRPLAEIADMAIDAAWVLGDTRMPVMAPGQPKLRTYATPYHPEIVSRHQVEEMRLAYGHLDADTTGVWLQTGHRSRLLVTRQYAGYEVFTHRAHEAAAAMEVYTKIDAKHQATGKPLHMRSAKKRDAA